MTHAEQIVDFFIQMGYRVTLGQLLTKPFGYRFIQRKHDLKKAGIIIELIHQDHEHPSNNLYELRHVDKSGQIALL